MLKGGFLDLHSAEVPKTMTMTSTLLFALGRWWQQREALDVPDGPEARCAKDGGAKPSLERPTPPLFVAGMVEHTEKKKCMVGSDGGKRARKRRPAKSAVYVCVMSWWFATYVDLQRVLVVF